MQDAVKLYFGVVCRSLKFGIIAKSSLNKSVYDSDCQIVCGDQELCG